MPEVAAGVQGRSWEGSAVAPEARPDARSGAGLGHGLGSSARGLERALDGIANAIGHPQDRALDALFEEHSDHPRAEVDQGTDRHQRMLGVVARRAKEAPGI